MKNGFLKVCTLSPALRVADCAYNTQETIAAMQQAAQDGDRKSTRLNSSHPTTSRMPSSA